MPDERARGPPCLRRERVVVQPAVELGASADEGVEAMSLAQRLGEVRRAGYRRTERRALAAARARAGLTRGGSSSAVISSSK